jgi:hypothetical protein
LSLGTFEAIRAGASNLCATGPGSRANLAKAQLPLLAVKSVASLAVNDAGLSDPVGKRVMRRPTQPRDRPDLRDEAIKALRLIMRPGFSRERTNAGPMAQFSKEHERYIKGY